MKRIKDLKIGTQLFIGFSVLITMTIVLGVVSVWQNYVLAGHTETIYNHPLQVRVAIGKLNTDISNISMLNRMLILTDNANEQDSILKGIDKAFFDSEKQIKLIDKLFLGKHSDVDELQMKFTLWKKSNDKTIELFLAGKLAEARKTLNNGTERSQLNKQMQQSLNKIEDFATTKSVTLYKNSIDLTDSMNRQLALILVLFLVISVVTGYYLLNSVRRPVNELILATNRFGKGDYSARSQVESDNEFGQLSDAFNTMVSSIQETVEIGNKSVILSDIMLMYENPRDFFNALLPEMALQTGSVIAAVYLLSNDKKNYVHYHSVGLEGMSHNSFSVESREGEFGSVLSTGTLSRIRQIPLDTRFVFNTVAGKMIPREIITIPVKSGKEIIAIISLASIRSYTTQAAKLITEIQDTLSARVDGVLTNQKTKEFSQLLEHQNAELEQQKAELATQSAELTEQNRELEIQKNQLHEASQLKTNFLSNMSHELRTPLNSVIALAGVLSRRLLNKIPGDEFSYLEVIERNGKHLLALINDILDISRIEAGREEIELSNFSTTELISDLIQMIKPQAQQKKIELIQKPGNVSLQLYNDINKCRHILQNLIANAVKFTEVGKVEIAVEQQNETVMVKIIDTGIGISESNLLHIFDEFRQADASTSRRYGGTGLGLAIARKYANLLGGTITVQSTLGVGSEFVLSLPLTYSHDKRIVEKRTIKESRDLIQKAPEVLPNSTAKTILLVDDSEPAIIQMKDFLVEKGYAIRVARNGEEALQELSTRIPDGIILDLMMPGVDGFSVLTEIRNSKKTLNIPVLILTAKHITKEDVKALERNHIQQLIQKGDVNRIDLLQAVDKMLNPQQEVKAVRNFVLQSGTKPKVLIVEDNVDNMITVKAIIGDQFEMLEAIDGEDGFNKAKKYVPDLILMDIALPGMDGIESFKKIRNSAKLSHIPIIALTASAMTSDREVILAHGFDAYIAKPIDEENFFSTIDSVLFGK